MENRILSHLKGKGPARGFSPPPRKKIRAPDLDTTELINANSLTLMGRLTNPSAQRLWSLFPFLSNRWNLKGKASGLDLGRGCFQFRFECEEDMQKVLDNRPYHYDQWMVILQKWEPTISATFPSMIPFWIEIQGLPKHYWQPEMLQTIGKELGEILDMEISNTSVKLYILLDGLQPLTKETVVEFPDGSEALLTLEYKNLKNHCLHCCRLTHEKKTCPGLSAEIDRQEKKSASEVSPTSKVVTRNYYTPHDNFTAPSNRNDYSVSRGHSREGPHPQKRYDNSLGTRVSSQSGERAHSRSQRDQLHTSGRELFLPRRHLTRERERYLHQDKDLRSSFRQNLQWREKSPSLSGSHFEGSESSRTRRPPLERSFENPDPYTPPPPSRNLSPERRYPEEVVIPSKDQVMGELREVTVQYTSCAYPT